MRKFVIAAIILAACSPASAQIAKPYVHAITVGTSSAQAIIANPVRKWIRFFNPNATAKIAVCPTTNRANGSALTCTVGGAGSITILPYGDFLIDRGSAADVASAWNAIADTGASALTILEAD